jgi:hypothetical protein
MNRQELLAKLTRHLPHRSPPGIDITRREDGQYVVTHSDDLGRERTKVFATRSEARRYQFAVAESTQRESATKWVDRGPRKDGHMDRDIPSGGPE